MMKERNFGQVAETESVTENFMTAVIQHSTYGPWVSSHAPISRAKYSPTWRFISSTGGHWASPSRLPG